VRTIYLAAVWLVGAASTATAQQAAARASTPEFVVKTVPLHHLSSAEAVKLLSPYVQTSGGGVYEISSNVRAVTIREVAKIYADMMVVLAQYDREPASVTLTFQLVAADNSTTRDPAVAAIDSLLRTVLKYSGYHLLSSAVATASENGLVSQSLSAEGEILNLVVNVTDLRIEGNDASVHLNVELRRPFPSSTNVLGTGVTVPIGQTVVLGTAAAATGTQRGLILTVRPQLTSTGKK
jgi:hypothetical protein